jgi:hypothetical protein
MRKIILIVLAVLVGATGLFAAYVAWDFDPDHVSPTVSAPTYASMFEEAVRRRTGRAFDALAEPERADVLAAIVASREGDPVREVALARCRALADRPRAIAILRGALPGLPPTLYETAVGSIIAADPVAGRALLDSVYHALLADPASQTPLGGYGSSTIVVTGADSSLDATFLEQSRRSADFSLTAASEMTLFFPEHPIYFVAVPNADDQLDRLGDSRFVRTLNGTPVLDDIWTLPLLRTVAGLRTRLSDAMGFLGRFFSPEELLRDNLLVAKYGNDFLLVSFRDKNVGVAETMVSFFELFGKDFGIRRWSIDGIRASTLAGRNGRTLTYATPGPYFVAATDTALLGRALRTFTTDRSHSLGVDPVFRREFGAVDPSGRKQLLFAWFNPTEIFEPSGSEQPAARRLAIVAAALDSAGAYVRSTPITAPLPAGTIGWSTWAGSDPVALWRYVVDVRSLGKNPVDSLARVAGVDIGREVIPYLGSSVRTSYSGVQFLRQPYGYSNTAFDILMEIPFAATPPAGFDTTVRRMFSGITSLSYERDTTAPPGAAIWIASDANTTDSLLKLRQLQPSFAVVEGRGLVIASTPTLLRSAVMAPAQAAAGAGPAGIFSGSVRLDTLASNSLAYLRPVLLRTDRYRPEEIDERLDPLRKALSLYDRITWQFSVDHGLRRGTARLTAK